MLAFDIARPKDVHVLLDMTRPMWDSERLIWVLRFGRLEDVP